MFQRKEVISPQTSYQNTVLSTLKWQDSSCTMIQEIALLIYSNVPGLRKKRFLFNHWNFLLWSRHSHQNGTNRKSSTCLTFWCKIFDFFIVDIPVNQNKQPSLCKFSAKIGTKEPFPCEVLPQWYWSKLFHEVLLCKNKRLLTRRSWEAAGKEFIDEEEDVLEIQISETKLVTV